MKQLQLGSMGPPKGGLGGNHILTLLVDWEKTDFINFSEQGWGLTQVGVYRVPQDPYWHY